MNQIKCPIPACLDKNFPLTIIFDTMNSVPNDALNITCKILLFIINNKNKQSEKVITNIIRANLGAERYDMINKFYVDTYDFQNNKFKRYFYFEKEKPIYDIIDSFNIIKNIFPVLQEVAAYYQERN